MITWIIDLFSYLSHPHQGQESSSPTSSVDTEVMLYYNPTTNLIAYLFCNFMEKHNFFKI